MQSHFFLNSPTSSSGSTPQGSANNNSGAQGFPLPSPSAPMMVPPNMSSHPLVHFPLQPALSPSHRFSGSQPGFQAPAQRFPFSAPTTLQHIPHRPPMLFTGANSDPRFTVGGASPDMTLRALQERVTQVAAVSRIPSLSDMSCFNPPHITPRNGPDASRMHLQELTHLNPRGAARVQPYFANMKLPSPTASSLPSAATPTSMGDSVFGFQITNKQTQDDVQKLLQFAAQSKAKDKASPGSAKRSVPTEDDDDAAVDGIPDLEDPDGKKSVEEWKKFRLRVMSRLRKQRWRAKKKAEVLAGVEHTRLEEEERLRRDRIRKQQQRAKKRQKIMDDHQTVSGEASPSSSSDEKVVASSSSAALTTSEPLTAEQLSSAPGSGGEEKRISDSDSESGSSDQAE